jgi:acyl dehydratase
MQAVTRFELDTLPSLSGSYVRMLLARKPGLRAGETVPPIEARVAGVRLDASRLCDYRRVCGFCADEGVPSVYPQVLATAGHVAILRSPQFPLSVVGMIHLRSIIIEQRPLAVHDTLTLVCRVQGHREVRQGIELDLVTEVEVGEQLVWQSVNTVLVRHTRGRLRERRRFKQPPPVPEGARVETWSVPANTGRRYARVSGDYNPIHLYAVTARLLGFRRPIAHGLWTLARSVAAIGNDMPEHPLRLEVDFKRPLELPAQARFLTRAVDDTIVFQVDSQDSPTPHLSGRIMCADRQRR